MSQGYLCCFTSPYRAGNVNIVFYRISDKIQYNMWSYIENDLNVGGLMLPIKIEFVKVVQNTESESFKRSLDEMLKRLSASEERGIFNETPEIVAKEFDQIEGKYWRELTESIIR